MSSNDHYPRVLLVMMTKVKAEDPLNVLIRNQFGGWPKDRLAQIHSGETPGRGEFCGSYYRLQAADRSLGGFFGSLRGGVLGMVATDAVERRAKQQSVGWPSRCLKVAKKRLGEWLIHSGVWELVFRIRLSKQLEKFVSDFKPDLIFCDGYYLGFTVLPLLIARRFTVPICFQTTDDWPSLIYRRSPVGWILRRRAKELIRRAKVRMAFGDKMQREYEHRYGVGFEVTYHLDDPTRFPRATAVPEQPCRIVYTGSLVHRRYEALQDLLAATRAIPGRKQRFEILVYSSGIPKDLPPSLLQSTELRFAPLPAHEELPSVLAQATILLLPESFNEPRPALEYSISTKAHLYMMSGRPILVYGPTYSGTVDYAARGGWGVVVSERNVTKLGEAVSEILSRSSRQSQIRARAQSCIERNHGLTAGRERFRQMLVQASGLSAVRDESQTDCTGLLREAENSMRSAKEQCAC